ncbi:MAG TPA: hypothetical protein VFQ27_00245 [Xanthobacteraceae bacterium]|nr:hypothetical protein [Xanthobacteraceae bacterium]
MSKLASIFFAFALVLGVAGAATAGEGSPDIAVPSQPSNSR